MSRAAPNPPPTTQRDPATILDAIKYAKTHHSAAAPVGIIAAGVDATDSWPVIAEGPAIASAVMLGVSGVPFIDFSRARSIAILAVHAITDQGVVDTHPRIHTAIAVNGVPHEMVEYGDVAPRFYDSDSPEWAESTARDVGRRTVAWLRASATSRMQVRPPRSTPHG